jgi:S-adenosylmethionine synthetase
VDRYVFTSFDTVACFSPEFTAKSLVAAGLARRALVQLSYAIGVAEPLSVFVDTYGTGKKTDEELVAIIRKNWDLRPGIIGLSWSSFVVTNRLAHISA